MKLTNKFGIICLICNDVLISLHQHDFKMCRCGKVGIDGGQFLNDYNSIIGNRTDWSSVTVSTTGDINS